jgi:hypothetical protein
MLGLQFENLVLNNKSSIQQKLKLDPNEIIAHGAYFQRTTLRSAGCQIDYLIQTNFSCLYVCEVKFSNNLIQADIIPEMQEKIKRLSAPKNFSYRPVLIHVNGVSEQVIESNFFANIVSFSDLLHN